MIAHIAIIMLFFSANSNPAPRIGRQFLIKTEDQIEAGGVWTDSENEVNVIVIVKQEYIITSTMNLFLCAADFLDCIQAENLPAHYF